MIKSSVSISLKSEQNIVTIYCFYFTKNMISLSTVGGQMEDLSLGESKRQTRGTLLLSHTHRLLTEFIAVLSRWEGHEKAEKEGV